MLDSSSSVFALVGSNPTECIFLALNTAKHLLSLAYASPLTRSTTVVGMVGELSSKVAYDSLHLLSSFLWRCFYCKQLILSPDLYITRPLQSFYKELTYAVQAAATIPSSSIIN